MESQLLRNRTVGVPYAENAQTSMSCVSISIRYQTVICVRIDIIEINHCFTPVTRILATSIHTPGIHTSRRVQLTQESQCESRFGGHLTHHAAAWRTNRSRSSREIQCWLVVTVSPRINQVGGQFKFHNSIKDLKDGSVAQGYWRINRKLIYLNSRIHRDLPCRFGTHACIVMPG